MAPYGLQVSVTVAKRYVAANHLPSGGRKCTERRSAKARHLYCDLDTDCDTRLTSPRASAAPLTLSAVISTSPGKYQVRWRIDCSTFKRQESTLKLLCFAFGRDPVSTNVSRIPRPSDYPSCRYDTTHSVIGEYPSDSTWNLDDSRLDIAGANATHLSCSIPSQKQSGKHTNSDHDWVLLWHDLALGKDASKVCQRWFRVVPVYPLLLYYGPTGSRCRDQPKFGSSKVSRWTTVSRSWKFALADSYSTLLRSWARGCAHFAESDCPEKDSLISSRI
jgi:hypothetical protein